MHFLMASDAEHHLLVIYIPSFKKMSILYISYAFLNCTVRLGDLFFSVV